MTATPRTLHAPLAAHVFADPPAEYFEIPEAEIFARIAVRKTALGERLMILGHHYQMDEIIQFADGRGDSYHLAKLAARAAAEFIVFAGVHFMAESADILTTERQIVMLPDMRAGCSMADMADLEAVEIAWEEISAATDATVVPITYINSSACLKAFVARHGGAVCTSANAEKIIRWALDRGEKLLFFPDQHLGRNTAFAMGIPLDDMRVWNPKKLNGGNEVGEIRAARILLWQGHCSVHMGFTPAHAEHWRKQRPDIQIIVHPECSLDVVRAADFSGSTGKIITTIEAAPSGSAWAIGTEIHLVHRLKAAHPDKFITSLSPFQCLCATMYRIRPPYLLWILDNLAEGRIVNRVHVPDDVAVDARLALQRMLDIAG